MVAETKYNGIAESFLFSMDNTTPLTMDDVKQFHAYGQIDALVAIANELAMLNENIFWIAKNVQK